MLATKVPCELVPAFDREYQFEITKSAADNAVVTTPARVHASVSLVDEHFVEDASQMTPMLGLFEK